MKEKIKNTCNKKYGGNAPICSPIVYSKVINSLLKTNKNRMSEGEIEIFNLCKEYFKEVIHVKPNELISKEIDIYIPEIKLGIEFNGNYWHSLKKQNYHLNKTKECENKNIRLIHIWEDEWVKDKDNIKNKLIDIFEGTENLNFTNNIIKLDRSWFNNIKIKNYILIEEIKPELIYRNGYNVENCGYLLYKRINILN